MSDKTPEEMYDISMTMLRIAVEAGKQGATTELLLKLLCNAGEVVLAQSQDPAFRKGVIDTIRAREASPEQKTVTRPPEDNVISLFGHKPGG